MNLENLERDADMNPSSRHKWAAKAAGFTLMAATFLTLSMSKQSHQSFGMTAHRTLSEISRIHEKHTRGSASKSITPTKRKIRERAPKQGRIVNGSPAGAGTYPFIVALYATEAPSPPNDLPVCGGSLITPSIVLTAAHCIFSIKAAEYGRYDVNDNSGVQFFTNLQRRFHPLYDASTFNHDYALVQLPSAVKDAFLVQLRQTPEVPEVMTIMGWGNTKFNGEQSNVLLEGNIKRFDTEVCRKNYAPDKITENMFCAADINEGRDSCQGDSGGPIIIAGGNVQVGIVSFGDGCGDPVFPGVYARLDKGFTWIEETICNDLDPAYCTNGKLPYIDEKGQAQAGSCEDTVEFMGLGKKMSSRDCAWVALRPDLRCKWYGEQFCPATCKILRCTS